MTTDPYPDLPGAELPVHELGRTAPGGVVDRTQLSEADSRLLDALSQPTTPVVSAVEDEARTAVDAGDPLPAGRRGAAAPVFQEPSPAE